MKPFFIYEAFNQIWWVRVVAGWGGWGWNQGFFAELLVKGCQRALLPLPRLEMTWFLIIDCEWQSQASLQALNLSQQLIIYSGLYAVSMYCAYLVAQGEHTVGDFVLLNTYFLQEQNIIN